MDSSKIAPVPETKLHFLDYWRIIRIRKTVILAVFLLVVITATLVTFVLPESYMSKARVNVQRDRSDIAEFMTGPQAAMQSYDPFFIQTEFEVMQSELILDPVIQRLGLEEAWGKLYNNNQPLKRTDARRLLVGKMKLAPVRNTSLIEIMVYSEKPEEAANIANAIAEEYQKFRVDERVKNSERGITALDRQYMDQTNLVASLEAKVDKLRQELNVSDALASADAPSVLMTAETLRHLNQLRIESQTQYMQQKTMYDRLKGLSEEELAQTLPTAATDSLLSTLLEARSMTEQRVVMMEKDFGEQNVELKKVKAQLDDLNRKIKDRVKGVMTALDSRVESLRKGLEELEAETKKAQDTDIAKANETRPYWEAKRRLEEQQRMRQVLEMRIATEKIDKDLPKFGVVKIIDKAVPGTTPVKPNKPLNIALGVIIGLVVGIGLAFFIEYLDTSVKTIDDVERALQSPVLGVIPQNVGLMIDEGIESPHAEAYRVLRTNLLFSRKDDKLNTIAVVSAGAGEGKSTTVFNLAAVFAQSGQRVIVVDSDLRRPTLHKMLKVTNSIGLTNYLLKQNSLEEVIQTSNIPTLDFMASGKLPSSSLGILSSLQMRELITDLKQRYDFVFFDSPPIMGVSDASILASAVDMTLQVIQYRRYPQPMNIRAKQLIEKVGGNLVGIVLNNINMSQDESYYYYSGYYHDYYYAHKDEGAAPDLGKKAEGEPAKKG